MSRDEARELIRSEIMRLVRQHRNSIIRRTCQDGQITAQSVPADKAEMVEEVFDSVTTIVDSMLSPT